METPEEILKWIEETLTHLTRDEQKYFIGMAKLFARMTDTPEELLSMLKREYESLKNAGGN